MNGSLPLPNVRPDAYRLHWDGKRNESVILRVRRCSHVHRGAMYAKTSTNLLYYGKSRNVSQIESRLGESRCGITAGACIGKKGGAEAANTSNVRSKTDCLAVRDQPMAPDFRWSPSRLQGAFFFVGLVARNKLWL